MANLVKYILLLAADLVIIGCLVRYCLSTLHWHVPTLLGARGYSLRTSFERLKAYSYVGLVLLSFVLAVYGSLIFLFSWMPRSDNVVGWSWIGAFVGAVALVSGLENTVEKASKLQMAEAFEGLIKQEVDQIRGRELITADLLAKLEQQIEAAVNNRTIYIEDARVCRDLLDIFGRLVPPKSPAGPQPGHAAR
jgi:hypothetical protein